VESPCIIIPRSGAALALPWMSAALALPLAKFYRSGMASRFFGSVSLHVWSRIMALNGLTFAFRASSTLRQLSLYCTRCAVHTARYK